MLHLTMFGKAIHPKQLHARCASTTTHAFLNRYSLTASGHTLLTRRVWFMALSKSRKRAYVNDQDNPQHTHLKMIIQL